VSALVHADASSIRTDAPGAMFMSEFIYVTSIVIHVTSMVVTWTIEDGRSDNGRWVVRDLDALSVHYEVICG
jgi:hypothetical protein